MSGQGPSKKLADELIAQVQELTTSDSETPWTADQVSSMSLHRLLQDPVRAAIYNRGWIDRTVDIQEMLRTSSPPSDTIVRTYRGPRSHSMNQTDKINIFVKFLMGKVLTLEVEPSETIGNLKSKIQQMEGLESYRQFLIFNGQQLRDHLKISDYKIQEMTIIHIIPRL